MWCLWILCRMHCGSYCRRCVQIIFHHLGQSSDRWPTWCFCRYIFKCSYCISLKRGPKHDWGLKQIFPMSLKNVSFRRDMFLRYKNSMLHVWSFKSLWSWKVIGIFVLCCFQEEGVKMLKHTGNLDKQIFFLARSSRVFWFNNIERKYTINNYTNVQLYTLYFIKNTVLWNLILLWYLKQTCYLFLHNLSRFPTCTWLFNFLQYTLEEVAGVWLPWHSLTTAKE